ncbi:hypothetical protein CK203_070120 [Vitis vinifera]|uniref:Uncharacterized protein n=1 Tax=Vitis vinifera TaxID=29760 RepID=A0A438EHS2_VITVI|nr:hypothetical protein CK203_070120 [Vitis vinifera]
MKERSQVALKEEAYEIFHKARLKDPLSHMFMFSSSQSVVYLDYCGCERGSGIIAQVLLFCIGNVLKWVVCTVYFQNCKKRTLEKIDGEVGLEDKNVNE